MAKTAAWTRKEGKSEKGGLNAKGRASYNKANPGKAGTEGPSAQAKDRKGRSEAKVFLRQNVWDEVQVDEFKDSQRPEQPYKQEP
jgi:hypothetical protein